MLGFYNISVFVTYLGLSLGISGIIFSIQGDMKLALLCLVTSGIIDMFDGKIARLLDRTDNEKKYGIELDSLSDMVCFGVAPVVLAYQLGLNNWIGLIIIIFYVLTALTRLAYFNVMEEIRSNQSNQLRTCFQGLPVTSIAIIFPMFFIVKLFFGQYLVVTLGLGLFIISILFISKITCPKLTIKPFLVLFLCGILFFVMLFVKGGAA